MPKENRAQINLRAKPELVEGLNEVMEHMRANSVSGIRITKTDAFIYLINFFKEHNQKPAKQKAKQPNK